MQLIVSYSPSPTDNVNSWLGLYIIVVESMYLWCLAISKTSI